MKRALLIVSFGVTTKASREKTLDLYKREVEASFPTYDVFVAYSSRRIIGKIKQREGISIDHPLQALERLLESNYDEILIQPFSVICGETFKALEAYVKTYRDRVKLMKLVLPLLHGASDDGPLVNLLRQEVVLKDKEALVLVGHGIEGVEQASYGKLEKALEALDVTVLLGTIKGHLTIDHVNEKLRKKNVETVVLRPFLLTSGHHVTQDIKKTWVEGLEGRGFNVHVDLKPLGEYESIRQHFIHLMKE